MKPLGKAAWSTITSCAVLALLSACSTTKAHRFQVDAYKHTGIAQPRYSFQLINAHAAASGEDADFSRTAHFIRAALSSKGMYEAPAGTQPEVEVIVDVAIEPRTAIREDLGRRFRPVRGYIRKMRVPVTNDAGVTHMEEREVLVEATHPFRANLDKDPRVIVYDKHLRIAARETGARENGKSSRELWSVHVTNCNENGDADESVPLMVSAAMDVIGQQSSSRQEVVVDTDDQRMSFVRGH